MMLESWKTMVRIAGTLTLMASLSACALATVGSEDAPGIFVLTTPDVEFGPNRAPLALQLVLDEPYAPAALDNNRIVFQPSANEIGYLAAARWSDRAPEMLQVLLVDTLDRSGKFQAVGRKSAGMRSDYLVRLSIASFGVARNGTEPNTVRIDIKAQLVRRFSDEILAAKRFESVATPSSSQTLDIVGAFDAATAEVLSGLALWIYDSAASAPSMPGR